MNVYDFDKTIYKYDSSVDFYLFELSKNPKILFYLPKQSWYFILHFLKVVDTKKFKEKFFCFLKDIKNVDNEVMLFWHEKESNIEDWYFKQKKDDDVIISASPKFLLEEICKKMNVKVIATDMDKETGKISGNNCKGNEKVNKFKDAFPYSQIDEFYSDSLSDICLAKLSNKAYIVKNGIIKEWHL